MNDEPIPAWPQTVANIKARWDQVEKLAKAVHHTEIASKREVATARMLAPLDCLFLIRELDRTQAELRQMKDYAQYCVDHINYRRTETLQSFAEFSGQTETAQ